jgi:hypothetical protein
MHANKSIKDKPFKLIACKVIMRADASSASKATASILIDRLNSKTLRCDPSIGGLATLSGYSRSNVQAGLKQLVKEGLLIIHRHGGLSGRNSYEFCWDKIFRLDEEFQKALFPGRDPTRNQGAAIPDIRAQTLSNNPNKKPERVGALSEPFPVPSVSKWQPRRELERNRILAFRSTSAGEVAQSSALRRWNDDLVELYRQTPAAYAIADLIDVAVADAATKAEMKRHGNGLRVILDHVRKTSPALLEGGQLGGAHESDGSSQAPLPVAGISHPDHALVRLAETRVDGQVDEVDMVDTPVGDAGERACGSARTSAKNSDLTKPDGPDDA